MRSPSVVPREDLQRVADAQARFLAAIRSLHDDDMGRPTNLPGWTVGHVLTHVARNADSHTRRSEAAIAGEMADQYPGGADGRSGEIEHGAGRTARQTVDDVRRSAEALRDSWERVPEEAWGNVTRDLSGRARPLYELPERRWMELEVHLVDLDIGVTHRAWTDDFVTAWLPRMRADAAGRLPPGASLPAPGELDQRDELAWLFGRSDDDASPQLGPWS
jgi:maleylpyruvate isomerase